MLGERFAEFYGVPGCRQVRSVSAHCDQAKLDQFRPMVLIDLPRRRIVHLTSIVSSPNRASGSASLFIASP